MREGKPDNALRNLLGGLGVAIYHAGLARFVIGLSTTRIRALLYHAVESDQNEFTRGLEVSVSPATFAANLDYFKRYYNVVPMSTVESGPLPDRPLVITFDDGYQSIYEHAMPALHERSLPACVYLIGRAVRGELVWVNRLNYSLIHYPELTQQVVGEFDDLATLNLDANDLVAYIQDHFTPPQIEALCNRLKASLPSLNATGLYADPAQIKAMQAHGIAFGFHSADHYNLSNCTEEECARQIDSTSISELVDSNTFAYPFGYFNSDVVQNPTLHSYKRIMTVGNNNNQFSEKHLDRTEVFSANPARVFAQLEIVEPVIAWLRRLIISKKGKNQQGNSENAPALRARQCEKPG